MTSVAVAQRPPTVRPLTLDAFLALPEEGPPWQEYLRGVVTEKSMPSELHGRSVAVLIGEFQDHLKRSHDGFVVTEVRHAARALDWVYLPDINVRLYGAGPRAPQARGAVERAPEFAIEVLSPDDREDRWLPRVDRYFAAGTKLVWTVDPEARTIQVHRPDLPASTFGPGDVIDAEPVLHGFSLDIAALFAAVYGEA